MAHDESTKNHQGGVADNTTYEKDGRMYETKQAGDGYSAMKLYLEKINPGCQAFFQFPKRDWQASDNVWYENRPLGVNKLGNMMREISQEGQLSRIYTNHSLRATAITLWSQAGISSRQIMAISGHRNEQSLKHYNDRPSENQLRQCSNVISEALGDQSPNSHRDVLMPITNQSSQLSLEFGSERVMNFSGLFTACKFGDVHINFQQPPNGSSQTIELLNKRSLAGFRHVKLEEYFTYFFF